jgi:hypothetical protein
MGNEQREGSERPTPPVSPARDAKGDPTPAPPVAASGIGQWESRPGDRWEVHGRYGVNMSAWARYLGLRST